MIGALLCGAPPSLASSAPLPDSTAIAKAKLDTKPALDLIDSGHFPEAEAEARRLLGDGRAATRAESLRVACELDVLTEALIKNGKAREPTTSELADRATKIKERTLGPNHPEVANTLSLSARLFMDLGKYSDARRLCERALSIRRRAFGDEHRDTAKSLNQLGGISFMAGDPSGAKPQIERALVIQERILGPDHLDIATTANNLANTLSELGDVAGARKYYERAIAINERVHGPDHPDLVVPLGNLGYLFFQHGDLKAARPYYERSLRINERALGPDHPKLGLALIRQGELLEYLGDYVGAKPLIERAVTIWEKSLGPNHENVGWGFTALGVNRFFQGDAKGALPYFERALAIREKALGPDHADVSFTLRFLGQLHRDAGAYDRARPPLVRALAIREKIHGPEHIDVASSLNDLADLLIRVGEPDRARPLLERSLRIGEKVAGPESPHVAWTLTCLANLERDTGDLVKAGPHYERAVHVTERALGADHRDMAWTRSSYAAFLERRGDLANAREQYERAISIREKAYGPDHPWVGEDLEGLASVLERMGESRLAFDTAIRAERTEVEPRRRAIRALPERLALERVAGANRALDLALSSITEPGVADSASSDRAWDAVIHARALVLDEIAARHRSMGAASRVVRLAEAYAAAQQRLATLVVEGPGDRSHDQYLSALDGARRDSDGLENALAEASASFRSEQTMNGIGLTEVVRALPFGSAFVAYVRYEKRTPGASFAGGREQAVSLAGRGVPAPVPSYLAFVWERTTRRTKVVPLGNAGRIDSLVDLWRRQSGRPPSSSNPDRADAACRAAGEALREAVWEPVMHALGGATRIIVVPDGALSLANLAALPVGAGQYLVDQGPVIHYLSAERDIIQVEASFGHGLLALGDPNFDAGAALGPSVSVPPASKPNATNEVATNTVYRSPRLDCPDFDRVRWTALPGTAREIKETAALWSSRRDEAGAEGRQSEQRWEAHLLTGVRASESLFKKDAPGRRVLHVATHGFFIGRECVLPVGAKRGIGGLTVEASAARPPGPRQNPLLLSGLVLAGANQRRMAKGDGDDGILTAEEIAAMDLSAVEWAVLSACETGVGEVRAGEGVSGLRRAFRVAGAGTLIMSLWSVDDEATRAWMRALYEGRWLQKLDTAEAVREASRSVLRGRRERGESTHPFYWAAFVAAGSWR